jgi:lambda repressor-like predicted transcriptional regulator
MHPADIQAALKKRGIMQKDIARDLGVSPAAISYVVRKIMVSDRIARAVAERIGQTPEVIFHEYYLARQKRKRAA